MTKGTKTSIIVGVIILLFLISWPFKVIGPGHTGVTVTLGAVSDKVLGEGLHLRIPFIQSIKAIDCRIQKLQTGASAASKDLQEIKSTIAVNYRVKYEKSASLYRNIGMKYDNIVIAPAIQESVKASTAKYTAEELITRRQEASQSIKVLLDNKLEPYGIVIDNLNIVNFDFSKGFNEAIEAKQTAQQLALKAEQDLIRVKTEAEQKVASAKAEAESLRVQRQEVTPEILQLRWIEKWDGHLPQYMTGDNSTLLSIPVK